MSARLSASVRRQLRQKLVCPVILFAAAACARPLVDLDALRPVIRGTIGPVAVEGVVEGGDLHLRVAKTAISKHHKIAWSHAPASASASKVLTTAESFIGTPYEYGGTTPEGFDCSGFVQYVFARHGVELPRTSREQATVGSAAPADITSLRTGDLMFFNGRGHGIDHVAIYVGEGRIIHASAGTGAVRYDDLDSARGQWFLVHHVTSRRILKGDENI